MTKPSTEQLFGLVMLWTILTGVFAWLPVVRIAARPEGYTWAVGGLSGVGTEGPFWVFIVLTGYVVVMLWSAYRGPRAVFHPMLLLWHMTVTGVVMAGVVAEGMDASWQGQGLHWEIPLWILVVPFALLAGAAGAWVVLDRRAGVSSPPTPWARANTIRLAASLALLAVALVMFRLGTNYDWVTAVAIATTILHWILLVESFAPISGGAVAQRESRQARSERGSG